MLLLVASIIVPAQNKSSCIERIESLTNGVKENREDEQLVATKDIRNLSSAGLIDLLAMKFCTRERTTYLHSNGDNTLHHVDRTQQGV